MILHDACINLTSSSSSFWCLAAALQRFIEQEGQGFLPLEVWLLLDSAYASLFLDHLLINSPGAC